MRDKDGRELSTLAPPLELMPGLLAANQARHASARVVLQEVEEVPEELDPTSAAYETMPIEDFGRAMLLGMGWNEKRAVGVWLTPISGRHADCFALASTLSNGVKEQIWDARSKPFVVLLARCGLAAHCVLWRCCRVGCGDAHQIAGGVSENMNQHLLLTNDALVLLCCAGKNDKLKPAQAKQYVARPGLLGLGAEPVPQAEKKERRFIR